MNKYICYIKRRGSPVNWTNQVVNFKLTSSLNGSGASTIVLENELPFNIQKFDKIFLFKEGKVNFKNEVVEDLLLYEGFIESLEANTETLILDCKNFTASLDYKGALKNYNFMNKTPVEIMDSLFTDWNTKTWGILICGVPLGMEFNADQYRINFEVNRGESFLTTIQRLSKLFNFGYTLRRSDEFFRDWLDDEDRYRLQISSNIGRDYTDATLNQFYISPYLLHNAKFNLGNTITNIKSTSSDKYNVILGQNKKIENETILALVDVAERTSDPMFKYFSYENGYAPGSAKSIGDFQIGLLLDNWKDEIRLLDFDIAPESNYQWLEVGDKVKCEVIGCGEYLDYLGNGFIIGKDISFDNGLETTTLKFGGSIIQTKPTLLDKLIELKGGVSTQKDENVLVKGRAKLLK